MAEAPLVKALLQRYPQTFAEQVGLEVSAHAPNALFGLLIMALLSSARISHSASLGATRAILRQGWESARKLMATTWEHRVQVLDDSGYARYDERTATMLAETAQLALDRYAGDLGNLRKAANQDPAHERKLLKEFKGIGDTGASIFLREVQLVWPELQPFVDEKALAGAAQLNLPADAHHLRKLVTSMPEFVRLIDGLIRVQLEHNQSEFLPVPKRRITASGTN